MADEELSDNPSTAARRVVLGTLRYPPAVGGVEQYVADIVASGARTGFEAQVVTSDLLVHISGERLVDPPDDPAVQRIRAWPVAGRWRYPVLPGVAEVLRGALADADVAHGFALYYRSFDATLAAARRTDRPVVVSPMAYPRRWTYWPYLRAMGHQIHRSRATVVHISEYELDVQSTLGLLRASTPTVRIPPLVDANPHAAADRPDGDGPVQLLFVGRLDPGKGVQDLPAIVDGVRAAGIDATLTVVGPPGPPALHRELVEAARTRPYLELTGPVSRDERDRRLATADCLLLPTRYEAFGMVLVEAMRSGAVPVAYPVAAVPEVLGHGRHGVLAATPEPAAMVDAIVQAVRDPDRLAELRRTAWAHAEATYGRPRWDRAWADLYAGVAR